MDRFKTNRKMRWTHKGANAFRPGRGQHDALDASCVAIKGRRVNWVLNADVKGFFDAVGHSWLLRYVGTASATSASPGWWASGSRPESWKTGNGAPVNRGRHKAR